MKTCAEESDTKVDMTKYVLSDTHNERVGSNANCRKSERKHKLLLQDLPAIKQDIQY